MCNVGCRKLFVLCVAVLVPAFGALCQIANVNIDEVESLITEWNAASNAKNIHGFQKLYGDRLTLNGQTVSKDAAVRAKQRLFGSQPWFRQRIITEITYAPHAPGTVKASFTREVFEKSYWKKYRSYLLVQRVGSRYTIVGEQDIRANRYSRTTPGDSPKSAPEETVTERADTMDPTRVHPAPELPAMEHPDSVDDDLALQRMDVDGGDASADERPFAGIEALFSNPTALGVVKVPRGYIYIFIGMLGLGGLMIFVADAIQSSRRRKHRKGPKLHSDAEHVVRDFRVQAAFESFVVTLFDPLYFKPFRAKAEPLYEGKPLDNGKGPDLILDYRQKEIHIRFAITCQYYLQPARHEVQLLSGARQDAIHRFAAERQMEVYYVLGFGGKPDDPRELFFIPGSDVQSEYMTRNQLLAYSKSGMFYYNRKLGRIQ